MEKVSCKGDVSSLVRLLDQRSRFNHGVQSPYHFDALSVQKFDTQMELLVLGASTFPRSSILGHLARRLLSPGMDFTNS